MNRQIRNVRNLLSDDVTVKEKGEIISEIFAYIDNLQNKYAYQEMTDLLVISLEEAIGELERTGRFGQKQMIDVVEKFTRIYCEQQKYQIWLLGEKNDCISVAGLLKHENVHLLGMSMSITEEQKEADYVVVCSQYEDIPGSRCFGSARIIRFDFIRLVNEISPEATCQTIRAKKAAEKAIGVVCGMSYEQRGITYENLTKNLMCLAGPSQDIYTDYYRFLWAYSEIVQRQRRKIEYCFIGMNAYRLWWDLSLGSQSLRVLGFYSQTKRLHHLDKLNEVTEMEEDLNVCREIMVEDFLEKDFISRYPYVDDVCKKKMTEIYKPTEEQCKEDKKAIERIFQKPYPKTFEENVGILKRWYKFLKKTGVKATILFMPFPSVFRETIDCEMERQTWKTLQRLSDDYEVDILDLSSKENLFLDADFYDWSHLNASGAQKVTEQLNDYLCSKESDNR